MLSRALILVLILCFAPPAGARGPTVYAAASLRNALEEASAAYASAGGSHAILSFAASSALARQIEHGAPTDLYISANARWMDHLASRGLVVNGTRVDLLRNRLVLIAPAPSTVTTVIEPGFPLLALLEGGRLAIGDPQHVPAGLYARAALERLGLWPSVAQRIAAAGDVRAALALVARGEAPLGIVYRTDAIAASGVRVVARFPAELHPPIVYPAALTSAGRHPEARRLLAYLAAPAGQTIFRRHGFTTDPDRR